MENFAIEIKNVSKIYRLYDKPIDRIKEVVHPFKRVYHKEFYALNSINLAVEKGASIGIIGKNGSGKSTLLKIITGVLSPTSGEVKVNGRVSALLELGAGFNPEYTGLENIYFNGTMMGYSKEEMSYRVNSIIEFADIGEFINQPVKTYSSGMFVRLAFAVAINVDPDILIIDEALAVGDMSFQLKCINKIKEFIKSGKTIFFVTHDGYTIKNLCDTAIWINDGKIEVMGNSEYVVNEYERYMESLNNREQAYDENNTIEDVEIAKVIDLVLMQNKERVKLVKNSEDLNIYIEFEVLKHIEDIVVGVAIFRFDGTYVCGLNTKLDNYSFRVLDGKNILLLTYDSISLLPGTYYLDIGLFEKSGVGRYDYKKRLKEFNVISDEYRAEGIVVFKHKWELP